MKIKRIINVLLSATLVLTVAATPSGVTAIKNSHKQLSDTTSVTYSSNNKSINKSSNNKSTVKKGIGKQVTLNAQTIKDYENPTDSFYEPKDESVTVIEDSSAYINDAVSVFFKDSAAEEDKQSIVDSINGEIVGQVEFMNEYEIKVGHSDLNKLTVLCDELMKNDEVEFASCSVASNFEENYVPNDPWNDYADWDDDCTGGYSRYNNWWIKATQTDKAWDYKDKFSNINVGIVDSGFYTDHEDIKGRISFATDYFSRHNAPDSHGTHVAGIIGAIQDNNIGISGVVPDCNLICVDWHADKEQTQKWNSEARIMSGFVNTVKAGAKVINFSIGSSDDITNGTTDRYKIIKDVEGKYTSFFVAKMLEKGYDFICCQSAGNGTELKDGSFYAVDASNNGLFCTVTKENAVRFVDGVTPQDILDRIIIVASAEFKGFDNYVQSSFSNGGSQVSICAPGSLIYSTYYDEENEALKYTYLSGTSMATPIVTGIASMVWSINQNFTGSQVKHFVCDKENTNIEVADNDYDYHLPTGSIPMVNALMAVEAALKATENDGTISGRINWIRLSANRNIPMNVVNKDTGDNYRMFTDADGLFKAELPEGNYTVFVKGEKVDNADFTVAKDNETVLEDINIAEITIDVASFARKALDCVPGLWAFIYVY